MTSLVELLMSGVGLEGASPRQVKAILDKLGTVAIVVEHRTLPQAVFGVTDGAQPFVAFWNSAGAMNTAARLAHNHLSQTRAKRAVREAMAVHAPISSAEPRRAAAYERARAVYLRQKIEAGHVTVDGAQAMAEGAL